MRLFTCACASVLLLGCPESEGPPLYVDAGASVATQLQELEQDTLDVLFVIDNSGSMASEQLKLASEIPRMVAVLTSGDRYATREKDVPAGLDEKSRRFTPVSSLHLGVVSTNFGGLGEFPPNSVEAVLACAGTGDSGKLHNATEIATSGVSARSSFEFQGYGAGDVVLPPDPSCALPTLPLYQGFEPSMDAAAIAHAFSCTARLGVRGCPFEQPLESMWNALAPSRDQSFSGGARGNGDAFNAGFLRPGAALAVVVLTDEDDCSITDDGKAMFALDQEAEGQFGSLNLRCARNESDVRYVRPLERYRDGLLGLKPGHPERVVFTVIGGLPLDARSRGIDSLLADPALQATENPANPGFPIATCTSLRGDEAYGGRRLLRTAKLIPNALVESICADDYAPVVDAMVNVIAPLMDP